MISSTLLHYLHRTPNLCLYQLGKKALPPTLFFPKVSTLTLIQCSRQGISHVVRPSIFPNLKEIHYLSGHPGQFDLHRRFARPIQWLFPPVSYPFYHCMTEAGYGRVESRLFRTYVHYFAKNRIDLNISGMGYTDGNWYCNQFNQYLKESSLHHCPQSDDLLAEFSHFYDSDPNPFDYDPYFECGSRNGSVQDFLDTQMENEFYEHLIELDKK